MVLVLGLTPAYLSMLVPTLCRVTSNGPLRIEALISGLMPLSRFLLSRSQQVPTRWVCPVVNSIRWHPELIPARSLLTGGPATFLGIRASKLIPLGAGA